MNCMVDSNVNYNFDLEVKGLKKRIKADPTGDSGGLGDQTLKTQMKSFKSMCGFWWKTLVDIMDFKTANISNCL